MRCGSPEFNSLETFDSVVLYITLISSIIFLFSTIIFRYSGRNSFLPKHRIWMYVGMVYFLMAIICSSALITDVFHPGTITGRFFAYWLQSLWLAASGSVVFAVLHRAFSRRFGMFGPAIAFVFFTLSWVNIESKLAFWCAHVLLYFLVLFYMAKENMNKRWQTLYMLVIYIIIASSLFLIGCFFEIQFGGCYCFPQIASVTIQFLLPWLSFITLYEDSNYWLSMGKSIVSTGLSVKLLQGSVNRLTTDDFSQLEQVMALSIDIIPIDDISLARKVGSGSHASVIRGTYKDYDIVLKRLDFQNVNSSNILSFCREAFLSHGLIHKNIVQFYGVTITAPELYLVYEYCNLGSVYNLLMTRALSWEDKLNLALGGANGLSFLHENKIIHRDVNSNNLLVSEIDGEFVVKVCDFGTARKVQKTKGDDTISIDDQKLSKLFGTHDPSTHTMTVKGIGTLAYLAPELLRYITISKSGAPMSKPGVKQATYDFKVDVYSYGMVLWEIAMQRRVFEEVKTCMEYKRMIMAGKRPPLDNFTSGFGKLMKECWHGEPKKRPNFQEISMRLTIILSQSIRYGKIDSPIADPSFSEDYLGSPLADATKISKDYSSLRTTSEDFGNRTMSEDVANRSDAVYTSFPSVRKTTEDLNTTLSVDILSNDVFVTPVNASRSHSIQNREFSLN